MEIYSTKQQKFDLHLNDSWKLFLPDISVPFQDIDYETFRKFLDTFLEVQTPEELCKHLFLSFVRRCVKVEGKAFKEMAVLSSTTACAPITSHNKGK